MKEEKINTNVDYSSALKERSKKLEEEFGVDFSKLQYSNEVLSFIAEHGKLPISNEPLNCGCVKLYAGSCDTHSVVLYVRDSHNIDEILKNPPFCFIENLEVEERETFDIKEARDEWLDYNYNVVAYFEPYEPVVVGFDNKKGPIWQECGDRFQVRLQTKEELIRQYCMNQRRNVMEESINKFLNYCEETGKRPEKVSIDDKTYVIEWHPNKMLKRIYPKPLSLGEIEVFYASNIRITK